MNKMFPKELLNYVYIQNKINNPIQTGKSAGIYSARKIYLEVNQEISLGCITERALTKEDDNNKDKIIKTFFAIPKFEEIVFSLKNSSIYHGDSDFCIYSNVTQTNFYNPQMNEKRESVSYGKGYIVVKDNYFYRIQNAVIHKSIDWNAKALTMDKYEEAERFCLERLVKS